MKSSKIQESTSALAKVDCFLTSRHLQTNFMLLRTREERKLDDEG